MDRIGFIGMGNMGYAMLKGALKYFDKMNLVFSDANEQRVRQVYEETGVRFMDSNAACANDAKYLVLAVKPQFYPAVLKNIVNIVTQEHVVISIAPGITIEKLQQTLGYDRRIVRAMPNTPALIGKGMTGVSYDPSLFSEEEQEMIRTIFTSFGQMQVVPEGLMSAVACASGSSPAYVYMFIEALADGVVKCGMPREQAYQFVARAVAGSAEMVLESGLHPGKLKDMVCSPGGTTIEAVEALEQWGFRNALMKATDACFNKCEKLK